MIDDQGAVQESTETSGGYPDEAVHFKWRAYGHGPGRPSSLPQARDESQARSPASEEILDVVRVGVADFPAPAPRTGMRDRGPEPRPDRKIGDLKALPGSRSLRRRRRARILRPGAGL